MVQALSGQLPHELVVDLVGDFLVLRQDVATGTLGRSAPGKFVETFVQILQFLESRKFEDRPNVDAYLRSLETRTSSLDDGLRICAARTARVMYTLRNKRTISHKGKVDPNRYDLQFLYSAAQWILTELIRLVHGPSMEQAGKYVEQIQAPIGGLVEDFGQRRLVLRDLSTREEMLILLHSYYPDSVSSEQIISSLDRRSIKTVRNTLRALWKEKIVEGGSGIGYKLTKRGFSEAITIVSKCIDAEGDL